MIEQIEQICDSVCTRLMYLFSVFFCIRTGATNITLSGFSKLIHMTGAPEYSIDKLILEQMAWHRSHTGLIQRRDVLEARKSKQSKQGNKPGNEGGSDEELGDGEENPVLENLAVIELIPPVCWPGEDEGTYALPDFGICMHLDLPVSVDVRTLHEVRIIGVDCESLSGVSIDLANCMVRLELTSPTAGFI